jgi:hypothetical protein
VHGCEVNVHIEMTVSIGKIIMKGVHFVTRAFRFVTTVFLGTFFSKGLRIILTETGKIEKKLSGLC